MAVPLFQVDAFTDKPFTGNPAGVCILSSPMPDEWMQSVAAEMNLSETAFLLPEADGYRLRWFTPKVEVSLCGHATLASSHILWEAGYLADDRQARFYTLSGLLTAEYREGWIVLDFPAKPIEPCSPIPDLERALGVTVKSVGKNQFDYLAEVENDPVVRQITPDFALLKQLPVRGVIVTARSSSPEFDFVSRFFAPAVGVNEDPVTGSAHCCLGPYWSNKLHKDSLRAYQASARGGMMIVDVCGDRVRLSGQAVTIFKTELQSD